MKRTAFMAAVLGLTCCSVQAQPRALPDGRQGASIRCRWESKCFEKAGAICPQGFDVLDRDLAWDNWVSMLVACKPYAGAAGAAESAR